MQMAMPLIPFMFDDHLLRQLIHEAKAGDSAAFERLIQLHERLVLRCAQRLLLNREAAQDAAQEVFMRLHKNLNSVDEKRDLRPWLYRTTSNVCYDILRRHKQDLPIDLIVEPVDQNQNPEEQLSATQQKQLVLAALKELTVREREVILLRDLEGNSTAEVASILRITEGTVRSQLSTGRIKIKNFVMAQNRRQP
jgi:RNA polymerase sigma-70 factor (ECF subfamily)